MTSDDGQVRRLVSVVCPRRAVVRRRLPWLAGRPATVRRVCDYGFEGSL